ncbi:MAG: FtsX-like permease family protein [Prevotellaceae bacterium]|nr:FtsX-like permease family protein [Prevotellaceae bacterium]
MKLSLFISRRYLFAKKSHNVINLISLVSAVGVAVGSLALVVALSVYNGLDDLIKSLYNALAPDLKITAVEGKVFSSQLFDCQIVTENKNIAFYSKILEENALLKYRSKQHIATVRGVDSVFLQRSGIGKSIIEGEAVVRRGDVNTAIVGKSIAMTLGLRPHFFDPLWVYFPKRGQSLQTLNPATAFNQEYLRPAGIFSIEMDADSRYVFAPLALVQNLLGYKNEVSSVELYLKPEANPKSVKKEVQKIVGKDFKVQTKAEQNEVIFRMMQSEKWATFFILFFVLLVASFNSIGSLTMLIIEKKKDVQTLRSLGATDGLVRRIFVQEGLMISLLGCAIGVALGLAACWAQIHFKIIKLSGNFVIDAYPVKIAAADILLVFVAVTLIGFVAANIPVRYLLKKL